MCNFPSVYNRGNDSYLDLRVGRDEAVVELVPGVVVPEHGRKDLVPDAGVGVAARGSRVAHGHVVATHGLLQVGESHVVLSVVKFLLHCNYYLDSWISMLQ